MGQEAACTVHWGKKVSTGKALLESTELIFRGKFRLALPFKQMKSVVAKEGELRVAFADERVVFELGPKAEKWADKIRNPRGLLDKLGVKPDFRVCVLGVEDAVFLADLAGRTAKVSDGRRRKDTDLIFFAVESRDALKRLRRLRAYLKSSGAIWAVWPKVQLQLREDDVRAAAMAASLVDVKVVSFTQTLSALKLVVPVARRSFRRYSSPRCQRSDPGECLVSSSRRREASGPRIPAAEVP